MFRHHLNLGYPIVAPGSVVTSSAAPFGVRDAGGRIPDLPWTLRLADEHAPMPAEEVVYCRPPAGARAVTTKVTGPEGEWVEVEQDTAWPLLVLWRDATPGINVLGVEPSTSRDAGRAQADRDGEVISLAPGERRPYSTVIRAGRREPETTDAPRAHLRTPPT